MSENTKALGSVKMADGDAHEARAEQQEREAALVSRVVARDLDAFEALYQSYRPRLSRFLMHHTRRPGLVEEILNDTMLAVWNQLAGFEGNSRLSTWIFAIAYRKAARAMRRSEDPIEADEHTLGASDEPGPEETADRRLTHIALSHALERLSPDHRTVVELTYFHEMGYREIAEIMDCPVDTVKTRMFHARKNLKKILSGESPDWV
jgi:RNA polymerase sigma factor (sigma-70 family)